MKARVASTNHSDSASAGIELAADLRAKFGGAPGAIVVFAAPDHDHHRLLDAIRFEFPHTHIVGASSAGEFTNSTDGQGMACVLALGGADVAFKVCVGHGLLHDPAATARQLVAGFTSLPPPELPFRAAMVMTDALAGHADILVDELTFLTAGQYQFFGGGAGDNARFQRTTVFSGTDVLSDAAVALEILSAKPIGIGVSHGWHPSSDPYRVTATEGMRLVSLDGFPAIEAFEDHADRTGQRLLRNDPLPHFLHNIVGIDIGVGFRLRVPLAVQADGSIICAAEVPVGSTIRIMRTDNVSAVMAAEQAADAAVAAVNGPAAAALFFDCVATRLRLGDEFSNELGRLQKRFSEIPLTGCNTHGQIARAQGQFDGFHNCTAVVCVFPE